jgi:hypothetical protein
MRQQPSIAAADFPAEFSLSMAASGSGYQHHSSPLLRALTSAATHPHVATRHGFNSQVPTIGLCRKAYIDSSFI